ncbi:magnesium-translocating P-type ATPase [Actinocrinis puniceicyclus]|uniref:Magnesium-transporting ATPase, P-type 1 n=1 Tax=Actinocrinis puniceicyclus TaxID=977794 RepID=A0A8J7WU99_9ACTN|nr:magnesium-translocating P-type ATPase [Actinocrinis puniceicyclus]MBS2965880.1 magnesium-translocating P-type ATPase [Actinocrinis puniceicyclus]
MTTVAPAAESRTGPRPGDLDTADASVLSADEVLTRLGTDAGGLSDAEAARRLERFGPNAVASHGTGVWLVLWHQLRSSLLGLLAIAAVASYFVGERSDALIIGAILLLSVGLGFVNELRAEQAAAALHAQISHQVLVRRGGRTGLVDVTALVPGDLVELRLGEIVPADVRLVDSAGLECDESMLTGESLPADKSAEPVAAGAPLAERADCAFMGTVVQSGSGLGAVVATGGRTEFGKIAFGLGAHQPQTEFQVGLRRFSMLLAEVAAALTVSIFVINVVLHRPVIDALLFSLAIAVGITPQLLPAVVSTSLADGSRRLAKLKVLVKRLVCIEDLGDVDVLFTDKTGTLTEGQISFMRSLGADGQIDDGPLRWGLLCNEASLEQGLAVGGNPLDVALWRSPAAGAATDGSRGTARLAILPFDHQRRMTSVLVEEPGGMRTLITKGAPEAVLERCVRVPQSAREALDREFAAGNRVIAVAGRPAPAAAALGPGDEKDLTLAGFLVFLDAPKTSARAALERLAALGVAVKVITGDNPVVATKVCRDLGLPDGGALSGADLDAMDDAQLAAAVPGTMVFARVSPEHKARIVRAQRTSGVGVAFLGDGVNDALALHAADVGISVDSGSDVAKDAADVILLEKDLGVLADGVVEGRRIFANTVKYVLMGTSSNFGNMFSAAGASLFLHFLPMLPSQILLNNLLYDSSQLAIPTDEVDPEQLARPSHWDIAFIRRFMVFFGPISSVFDFATFGVMLWVFHSGPAQFRSGWFVESLATQTLVIFAIRTRRIPFFRSRPSLPLLLAALAAVGVGAILPATPLAATLGFHPLPLGFFLTLVLMVVCYLGLIEIGKRRFYRVVPPHPAAASASRIRRRRRVHRRAAHFSTAQRPGTTPSARDDDAQSRDG